MRVKTILYRNPKDIQYNNIITEQISKTEFLTSGLSKKNGRYIKIYKTIITR